MVASKNAKKPAESEPKEKENEKDESPDDNQESDGPSGSSGSKRSLNAKEVPQFQWKIVGRSGHHVLTLFKSVEREDADAQFERLGREGYYGELEVLDINAVVKQPTPPKSAAEPKKAEKAAPKANAAKKGVRAPIIARFKKSSSKAKAKSESEKPASKKSKKSTAKAATKSTPKKKTATKKAAPRKSIKKKK